MAKVDDFLTADGKWKCIACGACCAHIKPFIENRKLPQSWMRHDGGCINLKDKRCMIYENRPEVCRIDKTLKPLANDYEIAEMCKVMKDFQEEKDNEQPLYYR